MYVSEDVKSVRRQDFEDVGIEALWIEVRGLPVLICSVWEEGISAELRQMRYEMMKPLTGIAAISYSGIGV